jgi:mono/diheme cytochrome c family protein
MRAGGNDEGRQTRGGPPAEPGVVKMHEPIVREHAEPQDGYEPAPLWLVFLCLALTGFGGWYLGNYSAGFDPKVYDERPGARGAGPAASAPPPADPMVLGKRTFGTCSTCHAENGLGLAGTYPPLAGSELLLGRPEIPVRILLDGMEGPVVVLGKRYDNVMPKWGHLKDEQLAAVLTFERSSWGNAAPPVGTDMVARVRKETSGRPSAWTAPELSEVAAKLAAETSSVARSSGGPPGSGARSPAEPKPVK